MSLAKQVLSLVEAELYTNYKTIRPLKSEDISFIKQHMGAMRYRLGAAYTIRQTPGGTRIRFNNRVLQDPRVKKILKQYSVAVDTSHTVLEPLTENVIDGVVDLGSKFLFHWRNHWIVNTKHGMDRIIERSKLSLDQLKFLFQKSLEKLASMKTRIGETVLFFSRSLNQGFVSAINSSGDLTLITFLPKGRHNPKPGTDVELLEHMEYTFVEIE